MRLVDEKINKAAELAQRALVFYIFSNYGQEFESKGISAEIEDEEMESAYFSEFLWQIGSQFKLKFR